MTLAKFLYKAAAIIVPLRGLDDIRSRSHATNCMMIARLRRYRTMLPPTFLWKWFSLKRVIYMDFMCLDELEHAG